MAETKASSISANGWSATRTPASTRMVAHDEEPENNEQKDFCGDARQVQGGDLAQRR